MATTYTYAPPADKAACDGGKPCLFCSIAAGKADAKSVVGTTAHCTMFRNIRQTQMLKGGVALLVVPNEHRGRIDQLHAAAMQSSAASQSQKKHLIALLHRLKAAAGTALKREYERDPKLCDMPVTMFFNVGYACSQPHLHLHVIIGQQTLRPQERLPVWLLEFRVTWVEAMRKIQENQPITASVASFITTEQVLAAYYWYTGKSPSKYPSVNNGIGQKSRALSPEKRREHEGLISTG